MASIPTDNDTELLNSSDFEFESAPARPFPDVGKASIEAMTKNAAALRYNSKKVSKQLTHTRNSPRTEYMATLWFQRFEIFRKIVLLAKPSDLPTGEDIERFVTSIIGLVKPKKNTVPGVRWIESGTKYLVQELTFYCPKFSLSPTEQERIASTIRYHFREGRLTKSPAIERNWVGSVLIQRLVFGILEDALNNGTLNWDVTLMKATSIVVMAATCARVGDLTKGRWDVHSRPFLAMGDITIRLVGGTRIEHFVARIVIRNGKGTKNDDSRNRVVVLNCLKEEDNNTVCPVKLILILALRLGHVNQNSIEELLQDTISRQDKTVVWTNSEQPLFCAFKQHGAEVILDRPAANAQLTTVLATAGIMSKLLVRVKPHDVRRGAARDIAHLNSPLLPNIGSPIVARALGHSMKSYLSGVTAHYIGDPDMDLWEKRVTEAREENFKIGIGQESLNKRRKLTSSEIQNMALNNNLDPSNRMDRKKASVLYRTNEVDEWFRKEKDRTDERSSRTSSEGHIGYSQLLSPSTDFSASSPGALSASGPSDDEIGGIDFSRPPSIQSADTRDQGLYQIDPTDHPNENLDQSADEIPIDPELLKSAIDLGNLVFSTTEEREDEPAEEQDDQAGEEHEDLPAEIEHALLEELANPTASHLETGLSALDFVKRYSSINITCNQHLAMFRLSQQIQERMARMASNSRDEVTFFDYPCVNAKFGCRYVHPFRINLYEHQDNYAITSTDAAIEKAQKKKFPCTREGCHLSYDTVGKLNAHLKLHDWQPQGCSKDECDPTVLFKTRAALQKHQEEHNSIEPTKCRFPNCTSPTIFTRSKGYNHHLRTVHKLRDEQLHQFTQKLRPDAFVPRVCPLGGCRSKTSFTVPSRLSKHLKSVHGLDAEEIAEHMR